jgi:hypothetical protein
VLALTVVMLLVLPASFVVDPAASLLVASGARNQPIGAVRRRLSRRLPSVHLRAWIIAPRLVTVTGVATLWAAAAATSGATNRAIR